MFQKLIDGIKGAINRMFGRSNFNAAALPMTAITDDMAAAIDHWVDLYYGRAPWLTHNALSLGIPAMIAREIANLVTLEAKVNVNNGDETEVLNPRAQFIQDTLRPVLDQLTIWTEYACAFGGIALRPYIDGDRIAIDCINADNFYPTSFNARGEITGAIFVEKKKVGRETYIRVEQQTITDEGYTITNKAYRGYGDSDIGTPCQLTDVDEWSSITPEITIKGVTRPLFAYFKVPQGNVVDANSVIGVSVYSRADIAGVLREADLQFQRLSWEYEAGEMAIDATVDAFRVDDKGKPILPVGKERLFRVNELSDTAASDGKFKIFAPALRDGSFTAGLNALLMRIEDLSGIARGTIADINNVARTATELKISRQRTYATVTSIQMALQRALDDLVKAVDALTTLYKLAPEGEYSITYTWDDSIVVDAETERDKDRQDVLDGIMNAWEYRVKWYGEPAEKAKAAVEAMSNPVQKVLDETLIGPEVTEE